MMFKSFLALGFLLFACCIANAIDTLSSISTSASASAISGARSLDLDNDPSFAVSNLNTPNRNSASLHSASDIATNITVPHNPGNNFDACDGTNGFSPILYHNYTNDDCVPNKKLDRNGIDCYYLKWPLALAGGDAYRCNNFCQMYTYFEYAQESPFPNSYCNYPFDCSISSTASTSWNWGISFTPKMGKAIKVGVSGSYGQSKGTSTGHSWSFQPSPGQCGYFSFVPVKKTSCGVFSESRYIDSPDRCSLDIYTSNICVSQVWNVAQYDGKSGPDGTVIFVNTDCDTRRPLDDEHQDPIYRHPEVPLDRGVSVGIQESWFSNSTCSVIPYAEADKLGDNTYAIEIFGTGMLYDSIGLNGSVLIDSIYASCSANSTSQGSTGSYSFTWYQANGTMINGTQSNVVQPNGISLTDLTTLPLSGAQFGMLLTLSLLNDTMTTCIGDALYGAGASALPQCY